MKYGFQVEDVISFDQCHELRLVLGRLGHAAQTDVQGPVLAVGPLEPGEELAERLDDADPRVVVVGWVRERDRQDLVLARVEGIESAPDQED